MCWTSAAALNCNELLTCATVISVSGTDQPRLTFLPSPLNRYSTPIKGPETFYFLCSVVRFCYRGHFCYRPKRQKKEERVSFESERGGFVTRCDFWILEVWGINGTQGYGADCIGYFGNTHFPFPFPKSKSIRKSSAISGTLFFLPMSSAQAPLDHFSPSNCAPQRSSSFAPWTGFIWDRSLTSR